MKSNKKDTKKGTAVIKLHKDTRNKLKILVAKKEMRTYDELLNYMIEKCKNYLPNHNHN
jgi:hypothetical protein